VSRTIDGTDVATAAEPDEQVGTELAEPAAPTGPAAAGATHATADRPGDGATETTAPSAAPSTPHPTSVDLAATPGVWVLDVPVAAIRPNPRQPRQHIDPDELAELADSIRTVGVLQPVVVRPLAEDGGYELVMGERRWRACQEAGLATVPALVRDTQDDALLRDALLENLHRVQLNPLEEAAAYEQLLTEFDCTQDQLASRLGRSRPQVSNTLRLLRLPPTVQRRVAAGVLSAGHARALLSLDDPAEQELLAARVVAEGLSVRSVEEEVALGGGRRRRNRRPRQPAPVPTDVRAAVDHLAERLDTRVRLDVGARRGRLIVDFADTDDLRRVVTALLGS
jgi:ParB family chromosome partitioning protein